MRNSCQQQLFLMARTACKQLARSRFCSSPTYITPLLASSAACQRFHFLPAAIISHGKICLQEAGKKSILLLSDTYHPPSCKQRCLPAIPFLASCNYFSWQDLLARSWQEVDSAPLRHISPPFLQAALLARRGVIYVAEEQNQLLASFLQADLAMRNNCSWQEMESLASSAACKKVGGICRRGAELTSCQLLAR